MKPKNTGMAIIAFACAGAFLITSAFCREATDRLVSETVWKWQQTLSSDGSSSVPDNPSRYTISFQPEGKLSIRADCNRAGGTYTANDNRLSVEVTHSTRAMCPPDSLEKIFLKDLGAGAIYFFKGDHLYIDLKYDSGTMKFSR